MAGKMNENEITIDVSGPTMVIQVVPDETGMNAPAITYCNGLTPFSIKMTLIRTINQLLESLIVIEKQVDMAAHERMRAIQNEPQPRIYKGRGK